MLMGRKLRL